MASDSKKQGDDPKLSISSPQSAEELASFHLHTREHNGGIPLSVHNPTSGGRGPTIPFMDTAIREMNDNSFPGFWHTGNPFIQASCASMSGHNPNSGELAMSNLFMTGAAQPNHSRVTDVDFLGLGYGIKEEADPKWDFYRPASEQIIERALLPLFNTSPDQTVAESSLNYGSNMANDSSSFPNCAGSNRGLTNEAQHRAPTLGQNASGPNPLPMQNVESSFDRMLNMGRLSHQAPAMNIDNGVTNAAWFRPTRIPLSSSIAEFAQPASDQPQNPPITTVGNFSPVPVMAPPFIGVAGSMARHNQSGPVTFSSCIGVPTRMLSHGEPGLGVVPFLGDFRSMPWQGQSGEPLPANSVPAVEAFQGSPFLKNIRVPQASKGSLDQSQASNPLKSIHAPAHTCDQVNVPQSSTSHSRPSLKRGASKLLPISPAAQRRKTRSTIPSGPPLPTCRPVASHVLPSSVNSLKPRIQGLLQNPALLQSLLSTQSTNYIKWHEEDKMSTSGYQCPICKRDLSYKPEGPLYEPDKLQPTSVLPCGHYFHSSCLLRVTPDNEAANPPCIPCSLDE